MGGFHSAMVGVVVGDDGREELASSNGAEILFPDVSFGGGY